MSRHYGIDEAWARLTPAQAKAAGKEFVVGYVSEDRTGKNLTAAEIAGYLAAQVAVLLVYEYSITAVEGGPSRGTRDAGIAVAQAKQLGYPAGCALGFAVDEDETAHPSNVDGYARAFTAACHAAGYRSMVYGGLATVKRCLDLGLVDLGWQTYAWSGSPTVWDPRAVIRQYQNGAVINARDVDLDVAMGDDYGAWMPSSKQLNGVLAMTTLDDIAARLTAIEGGSVDKADALIWWIRALADQDDPLIADTTKSFGRPPFPGLKQLGAKLDALALGGVDMAGLVQQIVAGVIASHDALTDADQPVIEAAVRAVLHGA